ncbi:MAG: ferritin [Victivallales bacterium]|nr:ferritin [Victivallales bacterium]
MISSKLEEAINDQINFEFYSSYVYLAMSAWFKDQNFNGFAHWMEIQAREELFHAMKLFHFVFDRGGKVVLTAVKAPAGEWKTPQEAFRQAFEHEQTVTSRISDLMDLALTERDHVAATLLQWFINEQIEEESSVKSIVDQLRMMGASQDSVFMLDRELNVRQLGAQASAYLNDQPLTTA